MVTVCYAFAKGDQLSAEIANVSCDNLTNKITGNHPTDAQIKKSVMLGQKISEKDITSYNSVLMRY